MSKLTITAIGTAFLVLSGVSASAQTPEMYTLDDIYYYLVDGTEATEGGYPLEPPPGSAPGDTRFKTLKKIYQDAQALFDQCDALPSDVAAGKTFFSSQASSWGPLTGTVSFNGAILVTGQTTSYHRYDDGWYRKGRAFDYTDNGDTVTDNVTGLIWAKDGDGPGCFNGGSIGWSSALAWAEGLTFAGYSDWRIPNARELYSLVVDDASLATPPYSPGPYINPTYFPNTKLPYYWTSTTYPPDTTWVLRLEFSSATLHGLSKDCPACFLYVRAVRGGN